MDLPSKQVKPREIGIFVDNFKRLLIKPPFLSAFCEASNTATLEDTGIF